MDSDDLFGRLRRGESSIWDRLEARKAEPLTPQSYDAMAGRLMARARLGAAFHAKVSALLEAMDAKIEAYARRLLEVAELDRLGLEYRAEGGRRLTVDGRPALDVWVDWPPLGSKDYTPTVKTKAHALTIQVGDGSETTIGTHEAWRDLGNQ